MNWFKSILSSGAIVENAAKGLDAVFLTNEEKTQYFIKYLTASMPMNVARRGIAIIIAGFWCFTGVVEIVLIVAGSEHAKEVFEFSAVYVMPPFTAVTSIYFAKHLIPSANK